MPLIYNLLPDVDIATLYSEGTMQNFTFVFTHLQGFSVVGRKQSLSVLRQPHLKLSVHG